MSRRPAEVALLTALTAQWAAIVAAALGTLTSMSPQNDAGDPGFLDVLSTDGTPIRVWIRGEGPPIVLVHGSLRDHTISAAVAQLQSEMSTYAIDRRGFGGSGDRDGYTIEQEFTDAAVVVDAIAARAGPVVLWGHSYGAGCAMGAAALTTNLSHLILDRIQLGHRLSDGLD